MNRRLAMMACAAALGGCASWTPKPPPESAPPPPEAASTGEPGSEPKEQGISGWWVSETATGPGSDNVRKVEIIFSDDGMLELTMLVEAAGARRFAVRKGQWREENGHLEVSYAGGPARSWSVEWDGGKLLLKDGEAELRLQRMPD